MTETKLESVDKKVEVLDKQISDIQNSLKSKENVGAVKFSGDKQEDVTSNETNVESKPTKKKLTKDVLQQNIIEGNYNYTINPMLYFLFYCPLSNSGSEAQKIIIE